MVEEDADESEAAQHVDALIAAACGLRAGGPERFAAVAAVLAIESVVHGPLMPESSRGTMRDRSKGLMGESFESAAAAFIDRLQLRPRLGEE